jgi:hypothetical protein
MRRAQAGRVRIGHATARAGRWTGAAQLDQEPNGILRAEQLNAAAGLQRCRPACSSISVLTRNWVEPAHGQGKVPHASRVRTLRLDPLEDTLTMLIRLIYLSKAVDAQTHTLTESILRTAHARNTQADITGVLCQGQGVFLQVLEGERAQVTALYARIYSDPRHKDVELIHCESITQRRYGRWSMAKVDLSDVDPQTMIAWPEFDPYSANGQWVMERIDELIAHGTAVNAPLP